MNNKPTTINPHSPHNFARPTETSEDMRCPDGSPFPLSIFNPPLKVTYPLSLGLSAEMYV